MCSQRYFYLAVLSASLLTTIIHRTGEFRFAGELTEFQMYEDLAFCYGYANTNHVIFGSNVRLFEVISFQTLEYAFISLMR